MYMNTTQRPNFVLVCIAVVLLSFSFAGEMLCSSIQKAAPLGPLADAGSTVPQLPKSSGYPTVMPSQMPSQVTSFASFTPSTLATDVDRNATTGALSAAPIAEIGDVKELIVIDSIQQLNAEAAEASSKLESVTHNHQVAYNLNFVTDNSLGNNPKSTNSAATKTRRLMAKSGSAKHKVVAIAVSVKQSGYGAFLPSRLLNKQAQLKLKRAIEKINLGESAKRKLKIALLESGHQDLIELKQEGTETSAKDKLISFLKKLTGYSAEEKIYVLKNLSEDKIKALKQILNAHNITLRAFIKA
jgi:hypothetical protein